VGSPVRATPTVNRWQAQRGPHQEPSIPCVFPPVSAEPDSVARAWQSAPEVRGFPPRGPDGSVAPLRVQVTGGPVRPCVPGSVFHRTQTGQASRTSEIPPELLVALLAV